VPYTKQKITYPADYNFWTFLAEFGGVMGLYFGITIITLYESIFFLLSEPDQVTLHRMPEKKFSEKVLYEKENTDDQALAVPQ
jgi:hypothetical protein